MKILLSAYACDPKRGSEEGVGWNWMRGIHRLGHELHVLTKAENRAAIEDAVAADAALADIRFHYYELPVRLDRWAATKYLFFLYYLVWQWGAATRALALHRRERFELVHHITFGSIRAPSFMGRLRIPFVFGPLGGGDSAPRMLRPSYTWIRRLEDDLRDAMNHAVRFDPLMAGSFASADLIIARTPRSAGLIPRRFQHKTMVAIESGVDVTRLGRAHPVPPADRPDGLKMLFAGRFLSLKGLQLAIRALAEFRARGGEGTLTAVGQGPEEQSFRRLAEKLNVADHIRWVPWLPRGELDAFYRSSDVFLFPSLRDGGANVVLEALTAGLPVVCLDIGGPGIFVVDSCGAAIPVEDLSIEATTAALADILLRFHRDRPLLADKSAGALDRARQLSWENTVGKVYAEVERLSRRPSRPLSVVSSPASLPGNS
ncbi:glycosyltransferase family 4 protein [Azospirillum sp. B506]|uniref:glycosyltransferase family 4 protein n=1 Tax=Azospirillum sp. B506 TaxID=137721 RepID=UPI0003470255|nr:glycosyltransferase [Azospirillum sp. B506]